MSNTINFLLLVEEILSEQFYEPMSTQVELEYLHSQLKDQYTVDQIIFGYEQVRKKKVFAEISAIFRNTNNPNNIL